MAAGKGDLVFDSVSREQSVRQQVADRLRAAVISGRMRPGSVYSAPALGERLGVSATPVREAMLDFVREGLVEVARNKGFRVTAISERELDDLAETRLLLEVPTMGAIAENIDEATRAHLERLRTVSAQLEQFAESNDLVSYLQTDTEFHTQFLALHGNKEIVKTVRSLRGRVRLYGLERVSHADLMRFTREHAQMIDLAVAGDRRELEALVRQHIGHVRTDWAAAEPIE